MSWNKQAAIEFLRSNALDRPCGESMGFISRAIRAGGLRVGSNFLPQNFGPILYFAGFDEVPTKKNKRAQVFYDGDIAVIQPCPGDAVGHIAMFDGSVWISDFHQLAMYPTGRYRRFHPPFKIYRMEQ